MTSWVRNENAANFYPKWNAGLLLGNLSFSADNVDLCIPATVPFNLALRIFMDRAGDITKDCDLAFSWYNENHLQAGDDLAGFGDIKAPTRLSCIMV
jgi:hypothetical protein